MNPLRQLAGQTAVYGLSSVVARIMNFLLVPFYTRVFTDTAEYGVINELYAYVAFFIVILTYGMETAYFRFSSNSNNNDSVYSTALVSISSTSLIFAFLIIFFHPYLAGFIGYGDSQVYILFLGLILSMDAICSIPFARLRYQNKAVKFAFIKLFNISVNIFFNLLFLLFIPFCINNYQFGQYLNNFYSEEFRVGYVFLSNFLASFFTLMLFTRQIINTKFYFSFPLLKSMLLYSYPLLIAGLAGTVNEVIDRIMLRYRLPSEVSALEQIGIYGANIKIAVLMTLFVQMFRYASEPFFFSQEKNAESKKLYAEVFHYFVIAGTFVFLLITLYLDFFKHIIGSNYHDGTGVVPVVLMGNLMLGIYFNLSIWYKLRGSTIYGALFAIVGALVTIAVNYIFIPVYGYMASAWGHFLSYSSMVIMSYLIGRRYFKVQYNVKMALFYLLTGSAIYFIADMFNVEDKVYRFGLSTLFITIFTAIVVINEWKRIKRLLFPGKF